MIDNTIVVSPDNLIVILKEIKETYLYKYIKDCQFGFELNIYYK